MNDYEQQAIFLHSVRSGLEKWPDLLPKVIEQATRGVQDHTAKIQQLAIDCETLAVMAMARRTKHTDSIVLSKLKQLNGRSWCVWDQEIAELEAKRKEPSDE